MAGADLAKRLIQAKGTSVVLRHFTGQSNVPGGGSPTRTKVDLRTKAVFTAFKFGRLESSTVQQGDLQGLVDGLTVAAAPPEEGDLVFQGPLVAALASAPSQAEIDTALADAGTKQLRIQEVGRIMEGEAVAAWRLHLRG